MDTYVGCSGWSYEGWLGHFYPQSLDSKKFLEEYSKVFDYVEIDSSFYRAPSYTTVQRWAKITPAEFRFTAKVPQLITHDKRLGSVDSDLDYFHKVMTPLADKLKCLLLQLPPSMTMKEGMKKLLNLPFDKRFRYAVEARHVSWFTEEVYSFLRESKICLAWSQLAELQTPPVLTTDFFYLRFIGDRSIPDSEFGKLQKYRVEEMQYWANQIIKLKKEKSLKSGMVASNNHYAGFGPGTANIFRKMLGMKEVVYEEMKQTRLIE